MLIPQILITLNNQDLTMEHSYPQPDSEQDELIRLGNAALQNLVYEVDQEGNQEKVYTRRLNQRLSFHQIPSVRCSDVQMDNFQKIMNNNLTWAQQNVKNYPNFFNDLKDVQTPQYLWIGCSDSRVPANQIVGLKPGELFVHRNIANQAPLSDVNALAVIQYAVQILKVKDIIVCGHYGCGGIKAAFKKEDHGPLEAWLSYIRDLRARYRKQLTKNKLDDENLLIQLNVKHNVQNISRIPIVQKSWKEGRELRIHGLVYRLEDGILNDLQITKSSIQQLPQEYRIY